MTTIQAIPLNRLVHSKANVRRTGRNIALDGLMASIAAHGLRQNLNVRPTTGNRFEVVAGGRRLEALRRLAKEGTVPDQHPVPCLVLDEGEQAIEVSLAENAIRQDMHPDDQCEAFKELVDGGLPIEDVAARFGVTPTVVTQRLKLAGVSPELRKLYRKGDLTLAHMMAFTLTEDHATQNAVWADLSEWQRSPDAIRRALTKDGLSMHHRLAQFVGLETYEAAGGTVIRSLFEDTPPVLADAALVQTLASEKLEAVAVELRSEGWAWVKADADFNTGGFGRVYPTSSDEETGQITYDPADLAKAGAVVSLAWDGDIRIERGLVDPEVVRKEKAAQKPVDTVVGYPDSVVMDLTAHRTAALRLELSRNTSVALGALIHAWALRVFYRGAYRMAACLDVDLTIARLDDLIRTPEEGSAHAAHQASFDAWREALPENPADLWEWCMETDEDRLLELLAFLTSLSVDAIVRSKGDTYGERLANADQLAITLGLNMHEHWQGRADGFYGRLSKAQLAGDLTALGEHQRAAEVLGLPKAEAASVAAVRMAELRWLPPQFVISQSALAEPINRKGTEEVGTEVSDGD